MPKLPSKSEQPWVAKSQDDREPFERKRNINTFYHTPEWRRLRKRFINKNPLCVSCGDKGIVKAAQVVDHITPIRLGGMALSWDNLQSMCHSCHNSKSGGEAHMKNKNF